MNSTSEARLIEEYIASFDQTWSDSEPIEHVRFIVLDSETTGLDPRTDRLITIGAVAVHANEIVLADTFEEMLRVAYNSSAVTVHGITRDEARAGMDEPQAVAEFLAYLRDGVIVGHHIGHDIEMLNRACERHFDSLSRLRNQSVDTMDLALEMVAAGCLDDAGESQGFSLDDLCARFDIDPWDRHTAGGDAFLTALVFLRLLRLAKKAGLRSLGHLTKLSTPHGS